MELRTKKKIIKQTISKREVDFKDDEIINNENLNKNEKTIDIEIPRNNKIKTLNNNSNNLNDEINIHKNHRQRLKSQFLENGITTLTDVQKLELLLFYAIPQKDTNPIAHKLLNRFGSLKNVLSAEPSNLMEVNGVKENTAILIKLVSGLFSQISMPTNQDSISSVSEAKELCSRLYHGVDVEQFYVICLTKSNKIKNIKLLKSGTSDEVSIQIRTITELALESKCNRIIITHNHPNGFADMSDEDCAFTYSLICSCLLNSIDIIDHIIVGVDKTISLAAQRILEKLKEKAFNSIQMPREKFSQLSSSSKEYLIDENI